MNLIQQQFDEKHERHAGDGCWPWLGRLDKTGYGILWIKRRSLRAHRVSYEIHVGPIPDGLCVCHRCDNPSCVKPEHLFLGTHAENMADMVAKGRSPNTRMFGTDNGRAKLAASDVLEIRLRASDGETKASIARDYPVGATTIHKILNGERWSWL